MQSNNKEEIEIDIRELFFVLLGKLWIILLTGIVCAIGAGILSKLIMEPVFTSSTKIYVINRQNKETTTYSDLQTGTQLTMDYKILVLSRPVTEQVISDLNLDITHDDLVSDISVNTPADTRILEISVENADPYMAKQLADSIAAVSAKRLVFVMEMEKVNIVEPGNIPTKPSRPNVKMNTVIGGLMGGLLAAFIILLIYIMDDSIKNSEDIERRLGLTTLGTIPLDIMKVLSTKVKIKKNLHKIRGRKVESQDDDSDSLEKDQLDFSCNEAYKSLRTNIQFCGKGVKTICITSTIPNEGKTVISFRLASTIAESGKKVLFIDADLRKSVIVGRLKIKKTIYGLSQYLSGMNSLEDVINKSNKENIDIIYAGPIPPNPSEMLGSDMFKELIMIKRREYDYIVVDTPPLGVVIDSANVAQVCDGTIIVVESHNISYKLVQRVLKQLEHGKCRILGAILNKVDMNRKGYYRKYYGKDYREENGKVRWENYGEDERKDKGEAAEYEGVDKEEDKEKTK